MLALFWPLIILVTVVTYGLIILTLPFNSEVATVFLFFLIAFWSRLPGVGLPTPGLFLYMADLVDLFSIIIALNLGGPAGAIFSLLGNFISRLCGTYPNWLPVSKDYINQAVICLFIPFIHVLFGENLLLTAAIYTFLRSAIFVVMGFLIPHRPIPQMLVLETVIFIELLIINSLYVTFFGDFFDRLLEAGVQFNWVLFLFATIVVIVSYYFMYGKSKKIQISYFSKVFKRLFKKKKKIRRPTYQSRDDIRKMI